MLYKIRLEEKSPLMQGKSGEKSHNVSRMPPPMPAPVNHIEIELAGGHRMRISGSYDPEALARLIRGLSL